MNFVEFCDEVDVLVRDGVKVSPDGLIKPFSFKAFICDSPRRSFYRVQAILLIRTAVLSVILVWKVTETFTTEWASFGPTKAFETELIRNFTQNHISSLPL